MRIGLDLFSLVPSEGRGAGYHRYVQGFVTALSELDTDHTFYLFLNRLNADLFPTNGNMIRRVIPLPPRRRVWPFRLLWQHGVLPGLARRLGIELMHFPMDTASFAARQPYVVTINDLIADVFYPEHFPRSQGRLKARYLFEAKRRSAQNARAVICPSRHTADLVVRHYGVARERITVTPYAADPSFQRNGAPR